MDDDFLERFLSVSGELGRVPHFSIAGEAQAFDSPDCLLPEGFANFWRCAHPFDCCSALRFRPRARRPGMCRMEDNRSGLRTGLIR